MNARHAGMRCGLGMAIAVALVFLSACSTMLHKADDASDAPLGALVEAVGQRLALADAVALAKWRAHQEIEDTARERVVIAAAGDEGVAAHLERAHIQAFFADQIVASKIVQYSLLATWRRTHSEPASGAVDLATVIRPQLDRLQHVLIDQLAATRPLARDPACPALVAQSAGRYADRASFDTPHRVALDYALAHVCAPASP